MVKEYLRFFRYGKLVWVGPRCPRCFKMGRNDYCIRTAWVLKARRLTSKSTHVRPSSPSVWSNHILCSFYFEFSNLSNVQILLIGHVDQVFHTFCGAIPPSLMVFFLVIWTNFYSRSDLMTQLCFKAFTSAAVVCPWLAVSAKQVLHLVTQWRLVPESSFAQLKTLTECFLGDQQTIRPNSTSSLNILAKINSLDKIEAKPLNKK